MDVNILADRAQILLLVLMRVAGAFSFAPVLSRSNIPLTARAGTTLLITVVVSGVLPETVMQFDLTAPAGVYLFSLMREFLMGVVLGTVTNWFFQMVLFSGEVIDMQAGLGMAKVFDPGTQAQMSLFGSVYNFLLYFYYLATNSHLTFIKILTDSFATIPLGDGGFAPELAPHMFDLFAGIFTLAVKLTLPLMIAELIVQVAIGLLMKSVPQIHIMVLNIEVKVVLGIFMLFLIVTPTANFLDNYLTTCFNTLKDVLFYLT
ncbi:MAG: flagellar biosynthetic protein FliR [Ruminococcus sp.]|nr:flagellar biosynthetic protein FliR [Ruminococcus sp.]